VGRVTLTKQASADLDEIWLQIALDNMPAADRLIDRIVARCQTLSDHPYLGPARPEIAPDARMLVVGDYVALYRVTGPNVQIVRVVHGARQLEGLFDPDPRK
jgi:toxin ParE1/3/4